MKYLKRLKSKDSALTDRVIYVSSYVLKSQRPLVIEFTTNTFKKTYSGFDCYKEFIEDVFKSSRWQGYTIIFFSVDDSYFILQELAHTHEFPIHNSPVWFYWSLNRIKCIYFTNHFYYTTLDQIYNSMYTKLKQRYIKSFYRIDLITDEQITDAIKKGTEYTQIINYKLKRVYDSYRKLIFENTTIDPIRYMSIPSVVGAIWMTKYIPNGKFAQLNTYETQFVAKASFSGRKEIFKFCAESTDDVKIRYYDINSQYPHVMKNFALPIGYPTIYISELRSPMTKQIKRYPKFRSRIKPQTDMRNILNEFIKTPSKFHGFMRCKVKPNTHNIIPVLPSRHRHPKYKDVPRGEFFDCYRKVGVWYTDELELALLRGDTIEEVYEYHEYKKERQLFTEFINLFEKIKLANEGNEIRQLAKQHMNLLFGKQLQKIHNTNTMFTPNSNVPAGVAITSISRSRGKTIRSPLHKLTNTCPSDSEAVDRI